MPGACWDGTELQPNFHPTLHVVVSTQLASLQVRRTVDPLYGVWPPDAFHGHLCLRAWSSDLCWKVGFVAQPRVASGLGAWVVGVGAAGLAALRELEDAACWLLNGC